MGQSWSDQVTIPRFLLHSCQGLPPPARFRYIYLLVSHLEKIMPVRLLDMHVLTEEDHAGGLNYSLASNYE